MPTIQNKTVHYISTILIIIKNCIQNELSKKITAKYFSIFLHLITKKIYFKFLISLSFVA